MKTIVDQVLQSSLLDILAFLFSIIYVILAARKNILCWSFAFFGSLIYVILCFQAKLYIDSILQLFYVVMALVGWFTWKNSTKSNKLEFREITFSKHIIYILSSILVSLILAYTFEKYTDQAYPYIDAGIFTFSLVATYLTTQKTPSSWLYFIVIDLIAAPVYWNRELQLMGVLNIIFAFLALYGYLSWIKIKKL